MLAISPQGVDSHARWAEKERFGFALLADTNLAVAEAYGVRRRRSLLRTVFLVDSNGIVRARHSGNVRAIFKRPKALAQALAEME